MYKRSLSFFVIVLIINLLAAPYAFADTKNEKQVRFVEKVKADLRKLGTGKEAQLKVELRNNSRLEGYVSASDEEGFTVNNAKTGAATRVTYPEVKRVKGKNLSTGAKIAIGVGIAGAIIFLILWFTTGPGSD